MICFQHQFSSVQDGVYALVKSHTRSATAILRRFSSVAFETVPELFWSKTALSRQIIEHSLFLLPPPTPHPPQAIGSVKILNFIPVGIVSQASQHCSSSGRKLFVVVAIYLVRHAVYVLGHLIPRASLGLLFICSLFAASSMNPWDGRHVYIVCQIIREMDGMCILSVR